MSKKIVKNLLFKVYLVVTTRLKRFLVVTYLILYQPTIELYKGFEMKKYIVSLLLVCISMTLLNAHGGAIKQPENDHPSSVLIQNVNIFDGVNEKLAMDQDVLVEENKIKQIGKNLTAPKEATVINGDGRTLLPGFIDAHTHLQWNVGITAFIDSPPDYHAALALVEAKRSLMRGFTTLRDVGGSIFGIKKSIDEEWHMGPRLYTSGAAIGMTSGHGDFRSLNTWPRQMGGEAISPVEALGISMFADGVPEVLTVTRDQFRKGAHFIKILGGGAVSGLRDPLDIAEYSLEELKAFVGEAERWNTYAAIHTYTDKSSRTALEAGVKTLEHANLITEDTVKLAKEKGAYISAQTGFFLEPSPDSFNEGQKKRHKEAADGLDNLMKACKKHGITPAFGTDFVTSMETKELQLAEFTNRLKWYTPYEILVQATSFNAEILALSGPRNPYPGKLGVIEEGALADILLINGNPLKDLKILLHPDEHLDLIMKDGKIYKNSIK